MLMREKRTSPEFQEQTLSLWADKLGMRILLYPGTPGLMKLDQG
jgi:hypothetical protein